MEKSKEIYKAINIIIDQISHLPVGLPLVWVYVWDVIKDEYTGDNEELVWDKFWETSDKEGWTLEYGTEVLYEHVLDWLIDNDFNSSEDEEEEEDN